MIRALGATYRWRVEGFEHYEALLSTGRPPIFVFWHGRILPAMLFWKNTHIVVVISQNFDGEWISRIIRRFGYGTARGSSSRGGARALVQLRRDLKEGRPAGFALDGPRGPARVAQPGAAFLAGASGCPILPFHMEASRYWTMGSWDATQIPKPGTTVAVTIGRPIIVPDVREATVETAQRELEVVLGALEHRARQLAT